MVRNATQKREKSPKVVQKGRIMLNEATSRLIKLCIILLKYIFNFIRCSIEQQPHKKQQKQANNSGVSRTRLSDK